jgi:hypothetical protein
MSILNTIKGVIGLDVHEQPQQQRPIISDEIKQVKMRQAEIQSRLRVLEVESELYKRDAR